MSSRPDFHSYFETDALVRLELHCKTFLPINIRETINRYYNLELATLFA